MSHLVYVEDLRGVPQNWCPSALAALAAGGCLLAVRDAASREVRPLVGLAVLNLLLSLDHASDYAWRETWFSTGRFDPWNLTGIAMAAVLGVAAMAAISRLRSPVPKWAAGAWGALQVASFLAAPGDGTRTVLSFAAYSVLLVGVFFILPRKAAGAG